MAQFYQCDNFNFNDFDLIVKDGWLYAMYVKKVPYPKDDIDSKQPNRYGLAKSKDGTHWEEVGDIIMPNEKGWDQSLWAGSISKQGDKYVIYYTGVLQKGRQSTCKIGKAYSTDMVHWEKDHQNPVLIFDPQNPYYSDEPKLAFRDPFFIENNGKNYILFCAKDKKQPSGKQGCIGVVEEIAPNQFKWLPPLFSSGKYPDGLECPALYFIKDKWYIIYGLDSENASVHHMRYAVSENFFGPFEELEENKLLPEGHHYIGRIVNFKDTLLYYSWFRDVVKGTIRERLSSPKEIKIVNNREITLIDIT